MSATLSEAPVGARKPRILVVENDPDTRSTHIGNMRKWGYEAYAAEASADAEDQVEALLTDAKQKARRHQCHLALVDMRLQSDEKDDDTSGLDLVPDLAPAVSVIISAYGTINLVNKALEAAKKPPERAVSFVEKNGDLQQLHASIENALRSNWPCLYKKVDIIYSRGSESTRQLERFLDDPEILDLLVQLFSDARELRITPLGSASRPRGLTLRSRSIVLEVVAGKEVPVVVKIAYAKRVAIERENYAYMERFLSGRFYGRYKRSSQLWNWGGAVYEFMGTLSPQMRLFSDFYTQEGDRDINVALDHLGNLIAELYSKTRELPEVTEISDKSIYEVYSDAWGQEWIQKLGSFALSMSEISLLNILNLPDPVAWIKQRIDLRTPINRDRTKSLPRSIFAVAHGDMHGDNMFVDVNKNVWVIDYERSGPGPILQDWVELENDILTRLVGFDPHEMAMFCELSIRILEADGINNIEVKKPFNTKTSKALKVIRKIRNLVSTTTGQDDLRLYLWSLLLNAVFRLMYWRDQPTESTEGLTRISQCLLLSGLICHRLENIENRAGPWPPKEWLTVLQRGIEQDSSPRTPATAVFPSDVFISYSSKDRAWVHDELLSRLEKANLQVCVDDRDFEPGAPSVTEMERAVKTSRKTILVLTPNYLKSAWAEFEQLMLMTLDAANRERRLIPLLKEKCELPVRIGYLNYVNLADPDDIELSWKRLLDALKKPSE